MHDNDVEQAGGECTRVADFQIVLDEETVTKIWNSTESEGFNRIVEIEPKTRGIPWRPNLENNQRLTYQAERVNGCDMFNNTLYRPELLDRIDGLLAGSLLPGE